MVLFGLGAARGYLSVRCGCVRWLYRDDMVREFDWRTFKVAVAVVVVPGVLPPTLPLRSRVA